MTPEKDTREVIGKDFIGRDFIESIIKYAQEEDKRIDYPYTTYSNRLTLSKADKTTPKKPKKSKGSKYLTPTGKPKRVRNDKGKLVNKYNHEHRESKLSLYVYIFIPKDSKYIDKIEGNQTIDGFVNTEQEHEPVVKINHNYLPKDTLYIGSTNLIKARMSYHLYLHSQGSIKLAKKGITDYNIYYAELNVNLINPSVVEMFNLDTLGELTRDDCFYLEYLLIDKYAKANGDIPLGNTMETWKGEDKVSKARRVKLRTLLRNSVWRKYDIEGNHAKRSKDVTPEYIEKMIRLKELEEVKKAKKSTKPKADNTNNTKSNKPKDTVNKPMDSIIINNNNNNVTTQQNCRVKSLISPRQYKGRYKAFYYVNNVTNVTNVTNRPDIKL